jgi:signal transduction histidine kinase
VVTGSSIPPNNLDLLFDRFYRTDSSRARSTGGSGLGLTNAKQPIEPLGGSISVESKPNEGSHFFFVLPPVDKELQS